MSRDPDCLFCKILAGDIPSDKVFEDEHTYAFRDIHPAAPTHILIIPKNHRERISDYQAGDEEELGRVMITARTVAAQESLTDYRLCINCGEEAGQTVWHLHVHLLGGRSLQWPPG